MEAGLSMAGLSRPGLSMVWLGVDSVSIVMGSLAGDMLPATCQRLGCRLFCTIKPSDCRWKSSCRIPLTSKFINNNGS